MKILIDVGGKDRVIGNTGLHLLCYNINKQDSPADKSKLFLEAVNTEEILQAKNNDGETPFQCANRKDITEYPVSPPPTAIFI